MLSFSQFVQSILTEGISEVAKYFPSISKNEIETLVKQDPTYKGGNELGKYGKWILQKYNTVLKDEQRLAKWENGDKKYEKPEPTTPDTKEDFKNIKDKLSLFEVIAKTKKAKIDSVKSLKELAQKVQGVNKEDVKVTKSLSLMQKSIKEGAKRVFESSGWLIIESQSHQDNVVFGDVTNWCTTTADDSAYKYYLNENGGKYLVAMNKKTGELYQLHFESDQFMNSEDKDIDIYRVFDGSVLDFLEDRRKASDIRKFKKEFKSDYDGSFGSEVVVSDYDVGIGFNGLRKFIEIYDYENLETHKFSVRVDEERDMDELKELCGYYFDEVMEFFRKRLEIKVRNTKALGGKEIYNKDNVVILHLDDYYYLCDLGNYYYSLGKKLEDLDAYSEKAKKAVQECEVKLKK